MLLFLFVCYCLTSIYIYLLLSQSHQIWILIQTLTHHVIKQEMRYGVESLLELVCFLSGVTENSVLHVMVM